MGQGDSKVVVHLHLDSGYYYAGDTVTGAVVLRVSQPMEVKSISVKVCCGGEQWATPKQTKSPLTVSSAKLYTHGGYGADSMAAAAADLGLYCAHQMLLLLCRQALTVLSTSPPRLAALDSNNPLDALSQTP
jgi:hypothetical protein